MIPTPDTSHVGKEAAYRSVYEPAEDTFALLDALEADAERIRARAPRLCVEIGCGSGVVSAFFQAVLEGEASPSAVKRDGRSGCLVVALDQNESALRCTAETAARNSSRSSSSSSSLIEPVRSNMLSALHSRLSQKASIDVLLFNPPYVPTTDEEEAQAQSQRGIASSWAGGVLGTRLVDDLVSPDLDDAESKSLLEKVLAPGGLFYLVAIAQNNPEGLVDRLKQSSLLDADIVLKRRAGREHLFIIRATKIGT